MLVANQVAGALEKASGIRKMFDWANSMRDQGTQVFDFSIGNPDVETLESVKKDMIESMEIPEIHAYMCNQGFPAVRQRIADQINLETGFKIDHNNVVMSCGAAGGLNVVLKTILNPNDEVIIFRPYFGEYINYIQNFGGIVRKARPNMDTFEPDLESFKKKITDKTKAIIINSPNNPTGVIYSEETLKQMSQIIQDAEKKYGHPILIISDEPYAKIVYDNTIVPKIFKYFKNAVIVNSFSKSLSLAGERIGYIAASSNIDKEELKQLLAGFSFSTRALGFVNAPAIAQMAIADSLDKSVDIRIYEERKNLLLNVLRKSGFECFEPKGAFYLFVKSPMKDDIKFVDYVAERYRIFLVPGSAFGCPGYFRLSYAGTSIELIREALPQFEKLKIDIVMNRLAHQQEQPQNPGPAMNL